MKNDISSLILISVHLFLYLSINSDIYLSINRTCHTRTAIGMNSASSAASARNLWWINPSLQRMTTSTALIVTIKTSLLAVMGVVNHSEEVNVVSGKQNCHLFLLRLYDSYVFFNAHFREKINM